MKVKTLIEVLQKYDPEARVYLGSWMGDADDNQEILSCYTYMVHQDKVILETADQFDVSEEIDAMLEHYSEDGWDETDAYAEMIDMGFTPNVIAKYYNKETANHMILYCESHGLDVGDATREYMKGKCFCEHCEDGECSLRFGLTDDVSCMGTIDEMYECNYTDLYEGEK